MKINTVGGDHSTFISESQIVSAILFTSTDRLKMNLKCVNVTCANNTKNIIHRKIVAAKMVQIQIYTHSLKVVSHVVKAG